VEVHAIVGRREKMKLDRRLIISNDYILGMELGALRKYLCHFGESAFNKGLLAEVATG
jgi:hypothetical protein